MFAYDPWRQWDALDQVMAGLKRRDPERLIEFMLNHILDFEHGYIWNAVDSFPASAIIRCNDANGSHNISTLGRWKNHMRTRVEQSMYGGEIVHIEADLLCSNYQYAKVESQVFYGKPT